MKKLLASVAGVVALLCAAPTASALTNVPGYDSVTLSTIPANAQVVGGYVAGRWPTFDAVVREFPHAAHLSIAIQANEYTVNGKPVDCLDTEPGDAVPSQDRQWVLHEIALGEPDPCVYSMESEMPVIKVDLLGLPVLYWDAAWDGNPAIPFGYQAHQWSDRCLGLNLDCDTFSQAFLQDLGLVKAVVAIDLGGLEHYERYPTAYFALGYTRIRERQTVESWDHSHCENPVRRPVCVSTHDHLVLLLTHDQQRYAQLGDAYHLPGRVQGLVNRLERRGLVKRWL